MVNCSLLTPGLIGFNKEMVILPGYLIMPLLGQTAPELSATGMHETFNVS